MRGGERDIAPAPHLATVQGECREVFPREVLHSVLVPSTVLTWVLCTSNYAAALGYFSFSFD